MALETVTHISDLVVTNPTSTDPKSEGDNHLRNIKTALKTDFPNISGPVTKTHTQLNNTLDKTGDTMTGNLNFSGVGLRLTGDFSNGTIANRLGFQSTTTNGTTTVQAIPNGTNTTSGFIAFNASDPTNASEISILATASDARLSAALRGAGTYLPLTVYTNGTESLRFETTTKNVLVTGSGGLGYGTGSGGTVTQATSKSTSVTLNKPCGQITMNNASLGGGASVEFTLNNTSLNGAADGMVVVPNGFTGYAVEVAYFASATSVVLRVTNKGATRSDALVILFQVIKGALS